MLLPFQVVDLGVQVTTLPLITVWRSALMKAFTRDKARANDSERAAAISDSEVFS